MQPRHGTTRFTGSFVVAGCSVGSKRETEKMAGDSRYLRQLWIEIPVIRWCPRSLAKLVYKYYN